MKLRHLKHGSKHSYWLCSVNIFAYFLTQVRMVEDCVVPKPRGRTPVVCALGFVSIAFAMVWLLDSALVREQSGLLVVALSLGATLHSLCLLAEEWLFHSQQRYGGSIQRMLRACFNRATLAGVCVVVLLLVVGCLQWTHEQRVFCVLTSTFYLLLKMFRVLGPAPVEISEVCESRQLNVAHGLAWSFYLGYLKLVIPALEEQVKKDSNQTGVILHSSRLHILLPLSAVAPAKIEEEDHNICFHQNLTEMQMDRAGVRRRVYKHSIYKITNQEKEYLCLLEYATPLLTLYEMSQDNTAGFSEHDRRQQVLLFHRTLSHILETSLECRNRYRLILIDDQQAAADPHYLSTEIIRHLQQQKREIPMDILEELPQPVAEQGVNFHHQDEPLSSLPSLMISQPHSLRSEPEENTDYTQNNHYNHNRYR
ncbi:stimulator of interferon genes protein isoform X2 [Hemibagrus wyckioides]|uniref:stimulator of interferon genes protein isoform X2 n=1 Tax=Hemibagrus wyckioides TaxID=337641 RepID=UPI00266D5942|nr:stimulator of interferon genes protein isoform X2 [Hemibagrus wyckioides]